MENFIDMVLNVDRTEFKPCSGGGLYNSFRSCFGMSLSMEENTSSAGLKNVVFVLSYTG